MTSDNPFPDQDEFPTLYRSMPTSMSSNIEDIETLYYNATERPKARFALALLSLVRLGGQNTKFTRREIFGPIASPKKKDPKALTDEGMSKDWQRKFLDRLGKDGLINITGNYISSPEDEQKQRLFGIVLNALDEDGLTLKAMLWPSQYADSLPTAQEVAAEDVSQEMAERSSGSSDFDAVKEIAERLEGMQTYLQTMVGHLEQVYNRLDAISTKMETTVSHAEASTESLAKVLTTLRDDNISKMTAIAERFAENGTRRKTLISQLTSDANAEGKLGEDLQKLLVILKEKENTRGRT